MLQRLQRLSKRWSNLINQKNLRRWWHGVPGCFHNPLQQTRNSFIQFFQWSKVCFCWKNYTFFQESNIQILVQILVQWNYSYLDKLVSFVKLSIQCWSNNQTCSKQCSKKDVPRLVSLIADTTNSQGPKFFVGDLVRILKKEKTFGKGFKQSFTNEICKILSIPTLIPPTYSLIDTDEEIIQRKLYQPELQIVRESPVHKGK